MRFWERAFTSILAPGSDRKGLASPPPRTDFSLFPSSGVSFLKTMLKLVLTRRLIADHRETRLSAQAPASTTSYRLATMLSSADVVSSLHRLEFRAQPYLRILSASGGRRLWPDIFG